MDVKEIAAPPNSRTAARPGDTPIPPAGKAKKLEFSIPQSPVPPDLSHIHEEFSGNRVLAYCFMSNHFHLLLEITPAPPGGLTDEELLRRLRSIYYADQVREVAKELAKAREAVAEGRADEALVLAIHARYTYRMHDLSEFMKSFVQRYTQWHNGARGRKGRLWEDRFKSVIVEDGVAARTIA
ncbi:MAG: hypothetical protein MUF04_10275, partial [Akkermansiaceae bacterium]|nr:hypothetical protein [Akkermansiaceae bacterium]